MGRAKGDSAVIKFPKGALLAAGMLAAVVPSAGRGSVAQDALARVAWLQGCWRAESPARIIEENWTVPRGGAMIGISSTVRRDSLLECELVILRGAGGVLTYEAHPFRQAMTTFTAREQTDTTIVFANPTHDYPQEVGYRSLGTDSLIAWIDGQLDGKSRRVEFRYARVKCAGP